MMTAATVCAVAQQLPDSVNAILSNDALLELLSSPTPQPRETPDTLHITPKPAITVPVAPRNHRERRETLAEQLRRWKPEELVADTTLDVSYMSVPVRMKLPAVFSRVSITLPEQAY